MASSLSPKNTGRLRILWKSILAWASRSSRLESPHKNCPSAPIDQSQKVDTIEHQEIEARLFDELVKVFSTPDQATMLAKKAGFPPERLPGFTTSLVFWTRIVEEAQNGAIEGGLHSIIKSASILYPSNQIFSQHHPNDRDKPFPQESSSLQRSETITGSPELIELIRNLIAGSQPQFAQQLSQQDIPHQQTDITSLIAEAVKEKIHAETNAIKRRSEDEHQKIRAEIALLEAQARWTRIQVLRELSEAINELDASGHEFILENENEIVISRRTRSKPGRECEKD